MASLINPNSCIEPNSLSLLDLLSNRRFRIPEFQRDYSWGEEQVSQLWKDIIEYWRNNTNNNTIVADALEPYFLGAIVTVKNSHEELEVIDGQQRLVTLTTVAAILREYCDELKESYDFQDHYEGLSGNLRNMISSYSGGESHPKVQFHQMSKVNKQPVNEFWRNCISKKTYDRLENYWSQDQSACEILRRTAKTKRKNVNANPAQLIKASYATGKMLCGEFIEKEDGNERLKRIYSLTQIFSECLIILLIDAKSHGTAYDLFEGLNDRGVDLSHADLIKNELIRAASSIDDSARNEVIDRWNYIKDLIYEGGAIKLTDFIHYSFLSRYGEVQANRLYRKVKSQVESTSADEYSLALMSDAEYLDSLIFQTGDWTDRTKRMLKDMHDVFGVNMVYPALLAGTRRFGSDKKEFEKCVHTLMSFCFRHMKIGRGTVSTLTKHMVHVAKLLNSEKELNEVRALLAAQSKDSEFIENFKEWTNYQAKLNFYVLWWLEEYLLSGSVPVEHGEYQNLEHIMPKAPTKKDWPIAYQLKQSDPERFKEVLWSIGNLLALPANVNKSIKNQAIKEKVAGNRGKNYKSVSLRLPSQIESYLPEENEWDSDCVRKRHEDIADRYVCKVWDLN